MDSGGSKGGRSRSAPPTDQNILNFMQFFGKSGKFVCWCPTSSRVGAPSYWESWIRPWWRLSFFFFRDMTEITFIPNPLLWLVNTDWNGTTLFWDSQVDEAVVYEYIEYYVAVSEMWRLSGGGGVKSTRKSTVYSCTMRRESWTITFPKELV